MRIPEHLTRCVIDVWNCIPMSTTLDFEVLMPYLHHATNPSRYTADKDNKKDFAKNLGKVGMEDWNLWHAPGTRTAEVVVDLQYPQRVHHYKISNANYDKVHDPESWEVWGLREHSDSEDEEKKWVMLHKVVNMVGEPPFGQCWKWKSFTVRALVNLISLRCKYLECYIQS